MCVSITYIKYISEFEANFIKHRYSTIYIPRNTRLRFHARESWSSNSTSLEAKPLWKKKETITTEIVKNFWYKYENEKKIKVMRYLQPFRLEKPSNQVGSPGAGEPGTEDSHPNDTGAASCQ